MGTASLSDIVESPDQQAHGTANLSDIVFSASDIDQPQQGQEITFGPDDIQEPEQPSRLQRVESALTSPIQGPARYLTIPGMGAADLEREQPIIDAKVQEEISHGNPFRAGLAQFFAGANKSAANLLNSANSPAGLATAVLGPLSKSISLLASAYFGFRGSEAAATAQQEDESIADALERRLTGASGVVGGLAGGMSVVNETVRSALQNRLGLKGDLASKVEQKVQQADAIKAEARNRSGTVDAILSETAKDAQARSQGDVAVKQNRLGEIKQEIPRTTSQLVADAAQATVQEQARVTKPFIEIKEATQGKPVTDAMSVRSIIQQSLHQYGVQDNEIPPSALKALGKRGQIQTTGAAIDRDAGLSPLYEVVDQGSNDLDFYDLTRIKDDLHDSIRSAKDGAVRAGLGDAGDQIDEMQKMFAEQNGFGEKYRAAKSQYMVFKRELGSGLMSKFLQARDVQEQAVTPKIAKLTTSVDAEAMRTILGKAGIDVSPLDDLIKEQDALTKDIKRAPSVLKPQLKVINSARTGSMSAIEDQATRMINEMGNQDSIVPGKNDLDLTGLSNDQIKQGRIEKLFSSAKTSGVANPASLVMITYGLLRMAMGNAFGAFPLAYGLTKYQLPSLVLKPAFQDWLIRESGADPKIAPRLKYGIAGLYPLLLSLSSRVSPQSGQQAASTQRSQSVP
jgi:hypothetical protein